MCKIVDEIEKLNRFKFFKNMEMKTINSELSKYQMPCLNTQVINASMQDNSEQEVETEKSEVKPVARFYETN